MLIEKFIQTGPKSGVVMVSVLHICKVCSILSWE